MFKSLCTALLIVSTLGIASTFAADEIQLQVNESILIGNQRISCNGTAAPAAPATKSVQCTCLEYNRYVGSTGALKVTADTSLNDIVRGAALSSDGRVLMAALQCSGLGNPRAPANSMTFGSCKLVDTN